MRHDCAAWLPSRSHVQQLSRAPLLLLLHRMLACRAHHACSEATGRKQGCSCCGRGAALAHAAGQSAASAGTKQSRTCWQQGMAAKQQQQQRPRQSLQGAAQQTQGATAAALAAGRRQRQSRRARRGRHLQQHRQAAMRRQTRRQLLLLLAALAVRLAAAWRCGQPRTSCTPFGRSTPSHVSSCGVHLLQHARAAAAVAASVSSRCRCYFCALQTDGALAGWPSPAAARTSRHCRRLFQAQPAHPGRWHA